MTRGDHALVPRRAQRPGTRGAHVAVATRTHPVVRRSSFAFAAALTSVALTTTAAVCLTGNDGTAGAPGTATGAGRTSPTALSVGSALVTDPELRSASVKATAVLADADYVTREGDLNRKNRKRVRATAEDLRTMLEQAGDAPGTVAAATRSTSAASRGFERTSLGERAARGEGTTEPSATAGGRDSASSTAEPAPSAAATDPTNLADDITGIAPINGQQTAALPALGTPLAGPVDTTPERAATVADDVGTASDAEADPEQSAAAPSAAEIEKVTASLRRLIVKTDGDAVVSVKAGRTPAEIRAVKQARAARAAERAAVDAREEAAARAAEAKKMTRAAQRYGNGQIPSSVLCGVSWVRGEQLRCDAAEALEDLNGAFRSAFGRNLAVTDGYRSYGEQLSVAASKGGLAAVPGTSNHGLGQAVDLSGGIESFGTAEHAWMVANAGRYGWRHPGWAQAGGSKPEAWHWEYGTSD